MSEQPARDRGPGLIQLSGMAEVIYHAPIFREDEFLPDGTVKLTSQVMLAPDSQNSFPRINAMIFFQPNSYSKLVLDDARRKKS